MDVKRTFLHCMDRTDVDAEFYTRVENFKIRGSSGKLNIALDGLPSFPALPEGTYTVSLETILCQTRLSSWLAGASGANTVTGSPLTIAHRTDGSNGIFPAISTSFCSQYFWIWIKPSG